MDRVFKTLRKVRAGRVVVASRLKGVPAWASGKPVSLQLDTQIRCTLKCVYCNPQTCFVNKVERVDLPISDIKRVLQDLKNNKVFLSYCLAYMNGDPLLEQRLPEITKLIDKELGCPIDVFTNGVETKNVNLLLNSRLSDIRFTISASNSLVYKTVHGADRFFDALETLEIVDKNKRRFQRVGVNFVLFDKNVHNLNNWKHRFRLFDQEIRVLHYGDSRDTSKELMDNDLLISAYRLAFYNRLIEHERPCACFGNMAIGVNGCLLQCCDTPYNYNYGNVQEIDLLEAWQKRLDIGLNAEGCKGCVQKNPHWKELFEKYVESWR